MKDKFLIINGWGVPIAIANKEGTAQRYIDELNERQTNKGNGLYSYKSLPVVRDNYPFEEDQNDE